VFGYSFKEILFQLVVGVLGSTITSALASVYTEKPAVIFIWGLCAFADGLIISNQFLFRKTLQNKLSGSDAERTSSPLKINFSDDASHSEFVKERAQVGQDMVSRRIFWVNIYNDSGKDIKNARGEMISIKVISTDGTEEDYVLFKDKTFPLTFQGGKQCLDFSPHMNVRLPFLSHASHFMPSFIRIEGHERPFMHESKAWKLKVKVTADGCAPVERAFIASVNGLLDVKAVD
jgi:hypothetical protein